MPLGMGFSSSSKGSRSSSTTRSTRGNQLAIEQPKISRPTNNVGCSTTENPRTINNSYKKEVQGLEYDLELKLPILIKEPDGKTYLLREPLGVFNTMFDKSKVQPLIHACDYQSAWEIARKRYDGRFFADNYVYNKRERKGPKKFMSLGQLKVYLTSRNQTDILQKLNQIIEERRNNWTNVIIDPNDNNSDNYFILQEYQENDIKNPEKDYVNGLAFVEPNMIDSQTNQPFSPTLVWMVNLYKIKGKGGRKTKKNKSNKNKSNKNKSNKNKSRKYFRK